MVAELFVKNMYRADGTQFICSSVHRVKTRCYKMWSSLRLYLKEKVANDTQCRCVESMHFVTMDFNPLIKQQNYEREP